MSSCRASWLASSWATKPARFNSKAGPGLTNGELLRCAATNGFEIFVAAEPNLQFQQNLR
jgi:hypothetical protein